MESMHKILIGRYTVKCPLTFIFIFILLVREWRLSEALIKGSCTHGPFGVPKWDILNVLVLNCNKINKLYLMGVDF